MSESLRKALRLFDLLHGPDFKSAPELATELQVKPRTIQGYVQVFREFDWPVESSHAKGYRVTNNGLSMSLTERELVIVAVLLAHGGSLIPTVDFERLTQKLNELLTPLAQSRIDQLQSKLSAEAASPLKDLEALTAIGRCLADPHLQMVMDYKKSDDALPERRQAVPLTLRHQDGWYYVDVFDLQKLANRSFRLDRIQRIQILRQDKPIPRPSARLEDTHKWDFGQDEPIEVSLEATPRLGAWLQERPIHRSQIVTESGDRWRISYRVKRLDAFVDWFLGLRGARAVGPTLFLAKVKERAALLANPEGTFHLEWG